MKTILASASERRKELLSRIVSDYEIIVSDFDEELVPFNGDIEEYVKTLAFEKGNTVQGTLKEDAIIIAADTIVTLDGKILGKPRDKKEAFGMLKSLSGKSHKVYSGIALLNTKNNKVIKEAICTEVKFSKLSDEEIFQYIDTEEPMDKAGAYGIQGYGGVFVEEIKGCYYNVVGLPLNKLKKLLKEI